MTKRERQILRDMDTHVENLKRMYKESKNSNYLEIADILESYLEQFRDYGKRSEQ